LVGRWELIDMGPLNRMLSATQCALLAACAHTQLPAEVEKFVERREACEHFRGEIPDSQDRSRINEVNVMIARHCTGTDAELAALRTRYFANGAVTEKLSAYETKIEAKK
jgi:hypothetical protein